MDVHKTRTSIVVLNASGRVVTSAVVETQAQALGAFIQGQRGTLHLTFEEGTYAAWLYDLLAPPSAAWWSVIHATTPCCRRDAKTTPSTRTSSPICCA